MSPKNDPINISIRNNNDENLLKCFHDLSKENIKKEVIYYLYKGLKYYFSNIIQLSQTNLTELSKQFNDSELAILQLFSELINLIINPPPPPFIISINSNEINNIAKKARYNILYNLQLALELDIKHDHGGSRGHGYGKECADFFIDDNNLKIHLKGNIPLDIINKNKASLLSMVGSNGKKKCLDETNETMKFPPLYKILDTTSKLCAKKYLRQENKETQTLKCLPTIIDSAGQANDVGEPPNFHIDFELIVQNLGELLFSSMFKSLVDNNIYLITKLPESITNRDEWLKSAKEYIMNVVLLYDNGTALSSEDITVLTGQVSQFSVPKITMYNSRSLVTYLKAKDSMFSINYMGNIWKELHHKWNNNNTILPTTINENYINNNENTKKYAEVLVRDLQYVKKICGDGCQNFATLVYGNIKEVLTKNNKLEFIWIDNTDAKGLYKNITTETFDTFLAVVSSVLNSSYCVGTTSLEFQYTLSDPFSRFYKKNYFEVWRSYFKLSSLLILKIKETKKATQGGANSYKKNKKKYIYISDSSDDSDYNSDNKISNEFYSKLLLNNKIKNIKGGDDIEKDIDKDIDKQLKKLCLENLTYEDVYCLNDKYIKIMTSLEFAHFITPNRDSKFRRIYNILPEFMKISSEITKCNKLNFFLKYKTDACDFMLSNIARQLGLDTKLLNSDYKDLQKNFDYPLRNKLANFWDGETILDQGFFYDVKDLYDDIECYSKKDKKEYYEKLIKIKSSKYNSLRTLLNGLEGLEGLEGIGLVKYILGLLKINKIESHDIFCVNIYNKLVEDLINFLTSIANKGNLFAVESSIKNNMTKLLQILFPIVYMHDNNTLSINYLIYVEDNYKFFNLKKNFPIKDKTPFNIVAENEEKKSIIKDFLEHDDMATFNTIHNKILSFCYCNLVYSLSPIKLLEEAILKQFTIFDDDDIKKIDKTRTIDIMELIKTTLNAWKDQVMGDDDSINKLEDLKKSSNNEQLCKFFTDKNKYKEKFKLIGTDLTAKKEHITMMQQYQNKYSVSLKKAYELIEFLLNGLKKLNELESFLSQNNFKLNYANSDLNNLKAKIHDDYTTLSNLLSKQKNVIYKFISDIISSRSKTEKKDEIKDIFDIETKLANKIKVFREKYEPNIDKDNKQIKNYLDELKEISRTLQDDIAELQRELSEHKNKLSKMKKDKMKKDKMQIDVITRKEEEIKEIKKNIDSKEDEILKNQKNYNDNKAIYDYNILLLYLTSNTIIDKEFKLLKEIFNIKDNILIQDQKFLKSLIDNKDNYISFYQNFNIGLNIDTSFIKKLKESEQYTSFSTKLKKIGINAIDLKYKIFLEKRKLGEEFDISKLNQNNGEILLPEPIDDTIDMDDKLNKDVSIENKVKLYCGVIDLELKTYKGLNLAHDYKNKIEKKLNKRDRSREYVKYTEAFPILKEVIIENDEHYKITDEANEVLYILSVREEELKTLREILDLFNNCKLLQDKLILLKHEIIKAQPVSYLSTKRPHSDDENAHGQKKQKV